MTPLAHAAIALWTFAAVLAGWHMASLASQLTYVTLADGRREARTLPVLFRLLLPLTPNVHRLLARPEFQPWRERVARDLAAAGYDDLLDARDLLALHLLLPILGVPFWAAFIHAAFATSGIGWVWNLYPALVLLGLACLAVYPSSWLRAAKLRRHNDIRRALPFVLDVLTLSVEAGMDFMAAIQRYCERRRIDALGEELLRVLQANQLGRTRSDSLRDLGARVGLPELLSVTHALVQADQLGVSIGSILRIQSEQIRRARFERAERLAHEAPVKMLGPLLLFIFPSVFLILLGPVLYNVIRSGF